jgi:hypothetical protein
MWWAATNIVNQQLRTADKGRFFSLEVGRRTLHRESMTCYRMFDKALDLNRSFRKR